ncbi:MAG: hypothetical protein ACJ8AI_24350 [Rhodopila sp.]
MQEGIGPRIPAKIALGVEPDVERRRWVAVFATAVVDEVFKRAKSGGGDIRVLPKVEHDVEVRKRAEPAGRPIAQVMRKRAVFGRDVVGMAIPCRIELDGWTAPFPVAIQRIMDKRLLLNFLNVWIVIDVP